MRRRTSADKPNSYVSSGQWPHAAIDDVAARYAQDIAQRLAAAIGTRSIRRVAEEAGLSHSTVGSILHGEHWPELATLVLLEVHLGARLWPDLPERRDV